MTRIIDVSPTNFREVGRPVSGRMLSITSSPDGQVLFAGSYSNLWASYDDGQTWVQLTWPQPDPSQFNAPGSFGGWCVVDIAVALGWRVDKHPRCIAQLTRSGFADIVGFGDCGVWTALGNGNGTFQAPNVVIADLGYQAGGWRVDRHPRFVVDLNGDGLADIIGFGDEFVWTAIGNGDGTFQEPQIAIANYCYQQDWRVDRHPRFLAHLTNSGFPDIVGFGEDGVWVALGNGNGTFSEPLSNPVLYNFSPQQHWRVDRHPRFLAHLTNSGFADIVGFGQDGVFVALGNGNGTFREPHKNPVLSNFCYKQGWRVEKHPRCLARLTSSGFDDIVAFGDAGVWTALSNGDGTFQQVGNQPVLNNFGYDQEWRVDQHPRFVAPLTNSGAADIVGFGDAGVWTAIGNGDGRFAEANYVLANLGVQQGWRVDRHPRFVADLTGIGSSDIVGFGDAGVWTSLGDRGGGFPTSNFVLANFGYGTIVLAMVVNDLVAGGRGIWRSTDGGSNWAPVYQFPDGGAAGQVQWALGSDHLVYAAGGSALAISKNAGTTFQTVFPGGTGQPVNHIAVWQRLPADPAPVLIYALGPSSMFVSIDGGTTWIQDLGQIPPNVGGAVSSLGNSNTPNVMVINPSWPLELYVAGDGSGSDTQAVLYRANYGPFFFGPQASNWESVPLPSYLTATGMQNNQDSGNVFLAITQKGRGDLLFYGAQRSVPYVGPLYPNTGSDWTPLASLHADLRGILLSIDFKASIDDNGIYQPEAGTVWLLSDGGISRSTDGGKHFRQTQNVNTLASVNVAGVANPGADPVLSLNTGDNDGFYSANGGQNWSNQDYGGGDNSCSYADPFRSNSMLVFTPRRDVLGISGSVRNGETVTVYETLPGNLPNVGGTADRHIVPGPPLLPPDVTFRDLWNADTFYGSRGSRPIVLGLAGEDPPAEGDYVFILDPTQAPVLVRTQNILDIVDRSEWITTATAPGQGANVYLQGPPLPKVPGLGVVQASGGHAATVFYVGGDAGATLRTWKQGATQWTRIVPANPIVNRSVGANAAIRFFVNPYQHNLIYILDSDHVKRSDDGGQTWSLDSNLETQLTWNNQIALSAIDNTSGLEDHFDLVLTDMQFDPNYPLRRFAVGQGGAFLTTDGVNWTRLLHTGALTGRPANCYYDWVSVPWNPSLYVSLAGRSLVKITDLPLSPVVIA